VATKQSCRHRPAAHGIMAIIQVLMKLNIKDLLIYNEGTTKLLRRYSITFWSETDIVQFSNYMTEIAL